MTEKRNESELPHVFFGPRTILAFRKGLAPIPIELSRRTENYVEYVPFSTLESVTRERDAAVRRVTELETEDRTLHDKLDALEHPSCSHCGCLLIPDNGPWKCEVGCVADPDVCDA